jgi:glycosyltransferase involved in cell wall biosynthesis
MLVQPGARHNYALACFLDRHDMLQRVYTDFALGTGHPLRSVLGLPMPGHLKAKLSRRATDALPARLIRSGLGVTVPGLGPRTLRRPTQRDIAASDGFYLQYFAGGADIRARAPHKPVISDVFIVPGAYRAIDREVADFPDWGETPTSPHLIHRYDTLSRTMFEQSDVLFCPSQAVIDDVTSYGAHFADKCRLIPYGASLSSAGGTPEPGRVLFCGSLQLRKGVQYIRAAADMLRDSHPHIRFVFAGGASTIMRAKLAAPNIELLGHLSKADLLREFASADLFLFPSLAEGAAGTVLEAMASGLPIVATREGGVDFTDGTSGIMLPPRDAEAIAAAVVRIVEDRELRASLSAGATREADIYSMAAWETRFIAGVSNVF